MLGSKREVADASITMAEGGNRGGDLTANLSARLKQTKGEGGQLLNNTQFLKETGQFGWVETDARSAHVKLWTKYDTTKQGRVALVKAVTTVDCSSLETLAFMMMVRGRTALRAGEENGELARVIESETTRHDVRWAVVRREPFPLSTREYANRSVAYLDDITGHLMIATAPLPMTNIDYGSGRLFRFGRVVRGQMCSLIRIKSKGIHNTQCTVTLIRSWVPGGRAPSSVVLARLPTIVGDMIIARETCQRDEEIDRESLDKTVATFVRKGERKYDEEEEGIIARAIHVGEDFDKQQKYKTLESPNPLVRMSAHSSGREFGAVTILDEEVEKCAARGVNFASREDSTLAFEKGEFSRACWRASKNNDHSFYRRVVRPSRVPGVRPFEILGKMVWKWVDADTLVVAFRSGVLKDYPESRAFVRPSILSLSKFERLPPVSGVPQTRFTHAIQADFKLSALTSPLFLKRLLVDQLMSVCEARDYFDQSVKIEMASRAALRDELRIRAKYSAEQTEILKRGATAFGLFERARGKTTKVLGPPSVSQELLFTSDSSLAWGRSIGLVAADKEDLIAYVWDTEARSRWTRSHEKRAILEKKSAHHHVGYEKWTGTGKMRPREAVFDAVRKKITSKTWLVVHTETEHEKCWFSASCTHKGPREEMAKEMLIVLTGSKPAVDARRVARNDEKPAYAIVDTSTELTLTRVVEMVFETGPSCVLQVHSLLTMPWTAEQKFPTSLVLSLAVSCVTAGFTAAVISFDYDAPTEGLVLSLFVSCFSRLIGKMVSDFVGVIQFRVAVEVGGAYWSWNFVVTIASTIVAARVFKSRDLEEGEFNPPDVFFTAVWVASAASLAAFLGILLLMKSKYRGSFLSIETGAQSVQNSFIFSDSDEAKHAIFSRQKRLWAPIRGEVQAWVHLNWQEWEAYKPEWFTDAWKLSLPDDIVPSSARTKLARMKYGVRKSDRMRANRNSLVDMVLGGSVASVASQASQASMASMVSTASIVPEEDVAHMLNSDLSQRDSAKGIELVQRSGGRGGGGGGGGGAVQPVIK
ncbi:hypothetical protein TeGR_g4017 [Tetraparma gracilis]|uniref:Uncharacterized protein n=1 Tax=Tetraparma gracilis TaxID=2962635 RepID=A0ABQ6MWX5_9STRA|nr:hypothetical protein TeGR_g4017 [Tetraparma gracilis]